METIIRKLYEETAPSAEEREKYEEIFADPQEMARVKELYDNIFCLDVEGNQDRFRTKEGETEALRYGAAYLYRIHWMKGYLLEKGIEDPLWQGALMAWRNIADRSFRKFGFYGFNGIYRGFLYGYILPNRLILGRLTFEMAPFAEDYAVEEVDGRIRVFFPDQGEEPQGKVLFQKGDPVLHVHIPELGRLDPERTDLAFSYAREFFPRYFPEYDYRAFVCSSWLLDPNLKKVLKPDSNILKFAERFYYAHEKENSVSLHWHIFHVEDFLPPEELCPVNDFQKRILDHVKAGNPILSGKGFILR